MAAYGALVSVMQIMDQIHRHPHPPISLHKNQSESLAANLTFLQGFLEVYNPNVSYTAEVDPLESRIAEAAYAAEDVIESYIVDQIHSRSSDHAEEISSTQFYQGLQKVIGEMDVIKTEIEKNKGVQIIKKSMTDVVGSFRSSSTAQKVAMVGLDEVLYGMLEKMVGGGVDRQIIPIVGMGGLGKTTLARNIYANQLVKEYFDICAWSTISQVHNAPKILCEILGQVGQDSGVDLSEYDLGEKLYKYLIGRRYLIVMDDMWNIEAWDRVRRFFPDNENGSRIVVTTRLSNLASQFDYSNGLDMKFMDQANSWNLFSKTIFGDEICPLELEEIGKKIVEGCKGLPLSIIVVGGLLSKCEPTRGDWEVIEENLNSIVNSEEDGNCLQILYMSYNDLPVYVKPCFLYLGIFYEDEEIDVYWIIPLWVAEGLIKPIDGKSLEEAGEEYLEELVARNLILVEKRSHYGELKKFKMHDLVRDVCLREAQKHKFLCVLGGHSIPHDISSQHCILCTAKEEYPPNPLIESLAPISSSLVRTLIGKFPETLPISSFRLLRVVNVDPFYVGEEKNSEYSEEESNVYFQHLVLLWRLHIRRICAEYDDIFIRLVNLRLLVVNGVVYPLPRISSSVSSQWNLQTLILHGDGENCLLEIWNMPLLRHVMSVDSVTLYLFDPPLGDDDMDEDVLENLCTLLRVSNLEFGEGVLERIPNIRKLKLAYHQREEQEEEEGDYNLHNLGRLHKLQVLSLIANEYISLKLIRELTLPHSLKKLVLKDTKLPWEDMKAKIGCLPLLQVLKLKRFSFQGYKWETVEGQFCALKFLHIEHCDLRYWITENTHFPRLEHLLLNGLLLSGIPSSIGDVPTLQSFTLKNYSDILVESAQRILEEQEELGNEDIQLQLI